MYIDNAGILHIDNFIFSPITNSIIGGMHFNNIELIKFSMYDSSNSGKMAGFGCSRLVGTIAFRLHYKAVNFNYGLNGNCTANITFGDKVLNINSDSEGWFEGTIVADYGGTFLDIRFENYSKCISNTYIEIDYLDLLPEYIDLGEISFSFPNNDNFIDYVNIYAAATLIGEANNPALIPLISYDGTIPTVQNNLVPYVYDAFNISIPSVSLTHSKTINYSLLYISSFADLQDGYVPFYYMMWVVKYTKLGLLKYSSNMATIVDNFSLGPHRLSWEQIDDVLQWKFINSKLVSPNIRWGSKTVSTGVIDSNTVTSVSIDYDMDYSSSFSGTFRLFIFDENQIVLHEEQLDTAHGNHEIVIDTASLVMLSFRIELVYESYLYMYGTITNETIIVNSLSLTGLYVPNIGIISEASVELFPNNQVSWPNTEIVGDWHGFKFLDYGINKTVLSSPALDTINTYTSCSFSFDCVEGNVEIEMVIGVNGHTVVELNNEVQFEIYRRAYPYKYTFPVSNGINSFKILTSVLSYFLQPIEQPSRVYIISITVPTESGSLVINELNQNIIACSSESGTVIRNASYEFEYTNLNSLDPWTWLEYSSIVSDNNTQFVAFGSEVAGNNSSSLSFTFPIAKPNEYGYPPVVQFYGQFWSNYALGYDNSHYISLNCNWSNQYNYYQAFGQSIWMVPTNYYQYDVPGYVYNISMPMPVPETATVTFRIEARNASYKAGFYFTKIVLPVVEQAISLAIEPANELVVFPINVSITSNAIDSLDIYYTTDGSNPKNSDFSNKFTDVIVLNEPKLIRYCLRDRASQVWLEGDFAKLYIDKPIENVLVLYDIKTIGITKYVYFYSVPSHVPIFLCKSESTGIEVTTCDDLIELAEGINSFSITTPIVNNQESLSITRQYVYSVDLLGIKVFNISNGQQATNGISFKDLYAVHYDVSSFILTVVPSVPSGTYFNNIVVTFRSNIDDCNILISSSGVWEELQGPMYIATSSVVELKVISLSLGIENIVEFSYTIAEYEHGVDYAYLSKSILSMTANSALIKSTSSLLSKQFSLAMLAYSYSNLLSTSSNQLYTDYKQYVVDNGILCLFADKDLTSPFTLHFNVELDPDMYVAIPDEYTTLYINDTRFKDYSQDGTVIRTSNRLASSTKAVVVPDMTIRLCIDKNSQAMYSNSMIVWTNIPSNNFIFVDNSMVQLSNDNKTYTQTIYLTNNFFYIRCSVTNITDKSIFGINIGVVSCEVADATKF